MKNFLRSLLALAPLAMVLAGTRILPLGDLTDNRTISEPVTYPQNSLSTLNNSPPSLWGPVPISSTQADAIYRWVVRAYFSDRQMVNDLASWIEPWEVNHQQGYLVVAVTLGEYQRLESMGFRLEIDQGLTAQLNAPLDISPQQTQGIPGFPCYRTVDETLTDALSLVSTHPDLTSWIDIGDSWELTQSGVPGGYDLNVLLLTNSNITGEKPKILIMGSLHAREYATAELVTRFAEYLVSNYDIDPDITWLLDFHEIHLLLIANPDGRKHAELGVDPDRWWRKNTNQNYCSPTSSIRGADLNRNFDFLWGCCGGASTDPCNELYRGPSAASEPETQAIQNYIRSEFPDQRGPLLTDPAPDTATGLFLDIHSYGKLVLWPWGFTATASPNHTALRSLGRKFSYFNSYTPQQAWALYPTDGTTDDFAYGDLGLASYTFELGGSFFESCSEFQDSILPSNLPALVYGVKVSRNPYLLPSGPDVTDPSVTPARTSKGDTIQLTAFVDDTRFSNATGAEPVQVIAAAEYYIDSPPWVTNPTPQAYPLSPVDGLFDQPVESVSSTIDTINLSPGRHILFLRGMDAAGNWGPFSAVFIHITQPYYFPFIVK